MNELDSKRKRKRPKDSSSSSRSSSISHDQRKDHKNRDKNKDKNKERGNKNRDNKRSHHHSHSHDRSSSSSDSRSSRSYSDKGKSHNHHHHNHDKKKSEKNHHHSKKDKKHNGKNSKSKTSKHSTSPKENDLKEPSQSGFQGHLGNMFLNPFFMKPMVPPHLGGKLPPMFPIAPLSNQMGGMKSLNNINISNLANSSGMKIDMEMVNNLPPNISNFQNNNFPGGNLLSNNLLMNNLGGNLLGPGNLNNNRDNIDIPDKIVKDQNFLNSDEKLFESIVNHEFGLKSLFSECQFSENYLSTGFFRIIKKYLFDPNINIFEENEKEEVLPEECEHIQKKIKNLQVKQQKINFGDLSFIINKLNNIKKTENDEDNKLIRMFQQNNDMIEDDKNIIKNDIN